VVRFTGILTVKPCFFSKRSQAAIVLNAECRSGCKAPGKPPRADQLREHERLRTLGFTVVLLDSKNIDGIL